nr:MAG TPA: Psmalmotoxin 1, TOXIN [Caudoviricetes sp.]
MSGRRRLECWKRGRSYLKNLALHCRRKRAIC